VDDLEWVDSNLSPRVQQASVPQVARRS